MRDLEVSPVLVLAAPASGASAITGMFSAAGGLPSTHMEDPTLERPFGGNDHAQLAEALSATLAQIDRDPTCPPYDIDPATLDTTALARAVATFETPTVIKAPATAFLLSALAAAGLHTARLLIVVRAPHDTVASLCSRTQLDELTAGAIVDVYHERLRQISERFDTAIVEFSADADAVLDQMQPVADRLGLDWDRRLAATHLDIQHVMHRSSHGSTSPAFEQLRSAARSRVVTPVDSTRLEDAIDFAGSSWDLSVQAGPQAEVRLTAMWRLLSTAGTPLTAVETRPHPAPRPPARSGFGAVERLVAPQPSALAPALVAHAIRPDRLVVAGCYSTHDTDEVVRSLFEVRHVMAPFGELCFDLPIVHVGPIEHVISGTLDPWLRDVATRAGWSLLTVAAISPGHAGVVLRRSDLTNEASELGVAELQTSNAVLESMLRNLQRGHEATPAAMTIGDALGDERRRADRAERALAQLRSQPGVRLATRLSSWARSMKAAVRRIRRLFVR